MQLRIGYELIYDCPQPTPMILLLHVHVSRVSDIVIPDLLRTDPPLPISSSLTTPLKSMVLRYFIERQDRKTRRRSFFYMGCRRLPGCISRCWNQA